MKNDNLVVLRVFLKSAPPLDLVLSRQESFKVLEWWKGTIGGHYHTDGVTTDGANYVLQSNEIAAMIVVPYPEPQRQQTVPQLPSRVPSSPGTIQFPGPRA